MGNRAASLATPCFAVGNGDRGHHHGVVEDDVRNNNGDSSGVMHILSFDGRESPAAKGIGSIHGAFLPSNQSTTGGSILSNDAMSFSGSSSFDSSNSFSFRTLHQPAGQYSGPLDSPSTSTSGMSVSRHGRARTDAQILRDLADAKHRRQCQAAATASSRSPILGGLRRAVASLLRGSPCVSSPSAGRDVHDAGEPFVAPAVATNGGGGIVGGAINDNARTTTTMSSEERVQWARGKAGEDRVHMVMSEEHEWMFVGIYDGFNGPDATDYLVAHLYDAVCRELTITEREQDPEHGEVLEALARALHATEAGYFAEADARAGECPELAMMGSCVLVVLIKGADVYVMNVGDSRAVLAQQAEPDLSKVVAREGAVKTEEIVRQFDACDMGDLGALQLTMDHSTSVYKEVRRIQSEHLDDPGCIVHGRVKGSLKVTRAFGAGYLKEPRWNQALLQVFRVEYVGTSPYISCRPYLRHHQLGSRDKFMILSSDGLYEYFTNEEVVLQVDNFTASYPGEDPAKYLSHEILCRAANRAGMEIHELLEVQQGDRRRYHDDVSIIIISLEGKIWRS